MVVVQVVVTEEVDLGQLGLEWLLEWLATFLKPENGNPATESSTIRFNSANREKMLESGSYKVKEIYKSCAQWRVPSRRIQYNSIIPGNRLNDSFLLLTGLIFWGSSC